VVLRKKTNYFTYVHCITLTTETEMTAQCRARHKVTGFTCKDSQ